MAKIFKTDSQERALKEIIESLKIISSINNLMDKENMTDCKMRIVASQEGETINEIIPIQFGLISQQLKDFRKKLIKDVQDKSKTYSIQLDEEELNIITHS